VGCVAAFKAYLVYRMANLRRDYFLAHAAAIRDAVRADICGAAGVPLPLCIVSNDKISADSHSRLGLQDGGVTFTATVSATSQSDANQIATGYNTAVQSRAVAFPQTAAVIPDAGKNDPAASVDGTPPTSAATMQAAPVMVVGTVLALATSALFALTL